MTFDNRLIMAFAETMLLVFCSYIVKDLTAASAPDILIGVAAHFSAMFVIVLGLSYAFITDNNHNFRTVKSVSFTLAFYFLCFILLETLVY